MIKRMRRIHCVHFIGIGGSGMSGIAEVMLSLGYKVQGSDLKQNKQTRRLAEQGATIFIGHAAGNIDNADAVVVSSAVDETNAEVVAAREKLMPIVPRAEMLAELMRFRYSIAVAGTHGKTSTTAMATEILAVAGMDPTGFVGGRVPAWGGNLRTGGGDLYVVEADEYDRSFLELKPAVAVVTNGEGDHLDTYGALEGVVSAFQEFLDGLVPDGYAVICADDHGAGGLVTGLTSEVRTYGLETGAQIRAVDVEASAAGMDFRVIEEGVDRGTFRLPVPGVHNLQNALGAAVAARCFEVDWDTVREGLAAEQGVGRRFDTVGCERGILVVDDYAHHPSEIQATLAAARGAHPDRRIVAVFQPHLFTRTRDLAEEFGQALAEADSIWVTDVFPAREDPIDGVTGELVAHAVGRAGGDVCYHPDVNTVAEAVMSELISGDLLLTMGAGSIDRVAHDVLARLRETSHA